MTFISAWHDRYKDRVVVWERVDGKRVQRDYKAPYYFYVPADDGKFEAVTGERLKKITCSGKDDFNESVLAYPKRFESDFSPLDKVMMDNYCDKPAPKLVVGFIDIEVDYDPLVGFPAPTNPYAPISSFTLYRNDQKSYVTVAVPPRGWSGDLPQAMQEDNYYLVGSERELLEMFLTLIEEVDLLSGWNSEFYDIPYIGKRVELLMGQHAMKRLGFDGGPPPRWTEKMRFKGQKTGDPCLELGSRVHLDYLAIFKKFNLEPRPSHSLDAISSSETNVKKVPYEGTLHHLYNKDFIKFLEYNRGDVVAVVAIDAKFKYIELANAMVHMATVNFGAVAGTVQLVDTAIANYAHSKLNKILFDKTHRPKVRVEGAMVLTPPIGLRKWIASCDIRSLYPSVYRSLNLSPEMIIGQLMEYEDGWRAVYNARKNPSDLNLNKMVTLRLENTDGDDDLKMNVGELIELLNTHKYVISGYGTILDQSRGEGILPTVLSYWFNGRMEMQAEKKKHGKQAEAILAEKGVKVPDGL